jgi:hypothetical protein
MFSKQIIPAFIAGFGVALGLSFNVNTAMTDCAIALDRNNAIYIGLDNPASIVASGVPEEQVRVTGVGVTITKSSPGNYIFRCSTPGEATVTVVAGDVSRDFKFRVKRMVDPVPRLGGNLSHKGGFMTNGTFKAQGGISAIIENYDIDAKCEVVSYDVAYVPASGDSKILNNTGARFTAPVQELINQAKPGDRYFFDDILTRCPGDASARNLGSLAFTIR